MEPWTELDLANFRSLPQVGAKDAERLMNLAAEQARRESAALRLYRPLSTQLAFHTSMASERIIRGGNRGGKSVAAFVEIASAATGIPIIGPNGQPLPFKYPTNRPLTIWVIGYGEAHIASPIYRLLFRPGAFKVIRDLQTGRIRAWRPWDPADKAREAETKPAPPLIPPSFIPDDGWGWVNKAERIFSVCRLKNGTEIYAFTSNADPKQGDAVDLIHIDEDIRFPGHVAEWQARLSDNKGRLTWAAFPHGKNFALVNMSRRAERQRLAVEKGEIKKADVEEFVLRFSDNPYMDEEEKRKRREGWTEDEIRARDFGEFVTDTILVYPTFSAIVHGTPRPVEEEDDPLDAVIRKLGGQIPDDWTRYLVLDPGHTIAAVLFAAVPPPKYGEGIVVYDELYLRRHDADGLAAKVHAKVAGKVFEAFIIDYRAGRTTPMGQGRTVKQEYARAFAAKGVFSARTQNTFVDGSDNVDAGINLVRSALGIQGNGRPKLRFVMPNLPNLRDEMVKYTKQIVGVDVKESPVDRDNHLLDCLRYLVSYNPPYVRPNLMNATPSAAYQQFQEWIKRRDANRDDSIYMGPGAAA
jgi:hypothetical protein